MKPNIHQWKLLISKCQFINYYLTWTNIEKIDWTISQEDCFDRIMLNRTMSCTNFTLPDVLTSSCDSSGLENSKYVPIHKNRIKNSSEYCRPVSLTSITCNLLEHIIYTKVIDHRDNFNILCDTQYGYRAKHSLAIPSW